MKIHESNKESWLAEERMAQQETRRRTKRLRKRLGLQQMRRQFEYKYKCSNGDRQMIFGCASAPLVQALVVAATVVASICFE